MKRAIIDLGTNTFNLLIGSVVGTKLHIDFATKEAVMLGMGGINEGFIADDAMQRAQQTLTRFKEKCTELGVSNILGIGTAAMRDAKNSNDLILWAKQTHGIEIRVISGDAEAGLIYKGVSLLHPFDEVGMIMDIGGGSNEFIYANNHEVLEAQSFNIGVSRIYQLMDQPDVFTPEIQVRVDRFFEEQTNGFFDDRNVPELIGASGSFETLYEMLHQVSFPGDQQMQVLPIHEVRRLIDWSINATLEDRMNNPWIIPMRKKMLPFAAYSILWVMEKLNTQSVTICPYSLKEGAFQEP
jgi:exopolyphosphatase/guanosine-5'-triphosphate,3'-diphosphate pyrophosphatase